MAPSGPPLVPPTIHETFGAGLIGALVNAMMYGLTTLQTYLFYLYYPNDSIGNKIMFSVVIIQFGRNLTHRIVSLCIYFYLVTNYDNPGGLTKGHWSLFISILCNVILACIVQAFFTYRIHQLASPRIRWWLSSIIGITVFAHLVFGVETVAFCFIKQDFARLHEFTIIAATPFAITAVLSDVMIAGSLCILLHGSRTGFRNTNTLVTTLIIYAINRCLLTSAVAIAEVIIFSIKPHAYWYLAVDFVIGKLWANSLLATLNSRLALQNMSSGEANGGSGALISDIEFESRRVRDSLFDFPATPL
ncbi:hypothetical protein FA15DRAFT_729106 [Coprinopsis marcescibilis]|uniref:DUF6534 domain-containing protein n=1 Tax=Coprinopsis marcescibilis TaxID=230819 RepID=A0A5C3L1X4_COPMA|nr:hypothetical protein FA15DRAFT_729106 [Coprinopsis marcescibilis]